MKPFSKSVWMTPAACGALRSLFDRPGARFLRADGEEGDEMQEIVAGADDPVEARLAQAHRLEIVRLLGRRQDRDLALDLGRDDDRDRAFASPPAASPRSD